MVRCNWCPMLLPDDNEVWRDHFFIEHGQLGYSVSFAVEGTDWDVAELMGSV